MQRMNILLCVVALGTICGTCASQIVHTPSRAEQLPLTEQQWQKRIEATADNPRQARKVILEGIYARKTSLVAQAYKNMYDAKPSDVRLGTFGYAAVISERFRNQDDQTFKPAFHAAFALLQHACAPEEETSAAQAALMDLKRTHDANSWLAWGDLRLRGGFDVKGAEKAYRQALKFEPNLAEAYWWLADLSIEPYDVAYFKAHVAQAWQYLDHAEKLEPGLHAFAVWHRAYLYLGIAPTRANITQALPFLREHLRLWPDNPSADAIRQVIVQLEKYLADKKLR